MNREALARTAETGEAHYWSRSRRRLWRKGEASGHVQRVREIRLDCDSDAILLRVEQVGGIACHTGREHCFFQRLEGDRWVGVEAVIKDPQAIYGHGRARGHPGRTSSTGWRRRSHRAFPRTRRRPTSPRSSPRATTPF